MSRTNTRLMKRLRENFYREGRELDANPDTRPAANCWLCQQRIDYQAAPGTTGDSHELDHFYPVSTHPELQEDSAGFRHSHRDCNNERGNRTPRGGLGEQPTNWW